MSFPDAAERGASASPSDVRRAAPRRFPRAVRLTRRADFLRIYAGGVRVSGPNLVLFGVSSPDGTTRLGITVTRKCGGAVARNLMKRRIREIFRHQRETIPSAIEIVVNVRPGADRAPFAELEREMERLFRALARKATA